MKTKPVVGSYSVMMKSKAPAWSSQAVQNQVRTYLTQRGVNEVQGDVKENEFQFGGSTCSTPNVFITCTQDVIDLLKMMPEVDPNEIHQDL